jgi:hypothetical protein
LYVQRVVPVIHPGQELLMFQKPAIQGFDARQLQELLKDQRHDVLDPLMRMLL